MKRRNVIIGTVAGLAIVAAVPLVMAGTALAHGQGKAGCFMRGGARAFGHIQELKRELNLTDEQAAALREIAIRTHEQNSTTHEALKTTFLDAAQVLVANPSDVAGARAVLDRNAATVEQLKTSVLTSASGALKVLTPEQRQKLSEKLAEHRE